MRRDSDELWIQHFRMSGIQLCQDWTLYRASCFNAAVHLCVQRSDETFGVSLTVNNNNKSTETVHRITGCAGHLIKKTFPSPFQNLVLMIL